MKKSVKWITAIVVLAVAIIYGVFSSIQPMEVELIEIQPKTVAQQF